MAGRGPREVRRRNHTILYPHSQQKSAHSVRAFVLTASGKSNALNRFACFTRWSKLSKEVVATWAKGKGKSKKNNGGIGEGEREENKDAKTANEDQRLKGIFDPRGKKTYGGSTKGPAFKTATTGELGPAIQSAAQEAPAAADSQRLPRDAKQTVKEYFESLGGQNPGGKQ